MPLFLHKLRRLRPHQQLELDRRKDCNRLPLFWEMRLGKSLEVIRWLGIRHRALGLAPRILLVAPLTPMIDWQSELKRERQEYCRILGTIDKRNNLLDILAPWTLITYGSVVRTPILRDIKWTAIILDESTIIKNPKAQITKTLAYWRKDIPLKAILSGLPAPQRWSDIFSQMHWIYDGSWMGCNNYWQWRDKHLTSDGYGYYATPWQKGCIKAAAHLTGSFLSRDQTGMCNLKIYKTRAGSLSADARNLYRSIVKSWSVPGYATKTSLVVAGWLRRITGGTGPMGTLDSWKYAELSRLLQEDIRGSAVVWYAWNDEITRCLSILQAHDIRCVSISGSTSLAERSRAIENFRNGVYRVLLINSSCGKYGLDLSIADTAIYFSNGDSYETRAQSEDRIENISLKRPLLYIDLITENTADEDTLEALKDKRCDSHFLASKIEKNKRLG